MADTFPKTSLEVPEASTPGQTQIINQMLYFLDAGFPNAVVISQNIGTPPASPSRGDIYIIPSAGTTGAWVGHEDQLVLYLNGWIYLTPQVHWTVRVADDQEGVYWEYDVGASVWRKRLYFGPSASGIAASTTQTQGQEPLINAINGVLTVANPNDVVTLITVRDNIVQVVINDGANTLQIFPASGDKIDGGAADASTTLASGKRAMFFSLGESAAEWSMLTGA